MKAAKAIPFIKEKMLKNGFHQPLVGDFHYNGHTLLSNHPECAQSLDKYRINPGNVGTKDAHDYNFRTMVEIAIKNNKPVRIGVNWGSLDQELFTKLMDENAKQKDPNSDKEVLYEAMVQSALNSAELAEKTGLPRQQNCPQRQNVRRTRCC
jgi:(E)-4-hydroxy-3-methylbut-2-enyl-diphosphate synthase